MIRKVLCPNLRAHQNRGKEKILLAYEEETDPSGSFLVFCNICKVWYDIRFNNSSPIIDRMPKGYSFKFVTTPSLVRQ